MPIGHLIADDYEADEGYSILTDGDYELEIDIDDEYPFVTVKPKTINPFSDDDYPDEDACYQYD